MFRAFINTPRLCVCDSAAAPVIALPFLQKNQNDCRARAFEITFLDYNQN
ncbi:MAG: hypothetical protein J1E07_03865 [Treponema sp.]|nr:hypothetical protein [Treponema sp.]